MKFDETSLGFIEREIMDTNLNDSVLLETLVVGVVVVIVVVVVVVIAIVRAFSKPLFLKW